MTDEKSLGDAMSAAGPPQTTPSTVPDNQIPQPAVPASASPDADAVKPAPAVPSLGAPQPATPAPPAAGAPVDPHALHTSLFKGILATLAGGSQRPMHNPDGTPMTNPDGSVKMGTASVKTLGNSILAGALSAMVAGMATPDKYTKFGEGPTGRHIPDYSGAFGAGAQAGAAKTQAGEQTKAQKEADDAQARSFSTFDHNLKMHQLMIANAKADTEVQQDSVDDWQDMNDAMAQEEAKGGLVDAKGNPIQSIYSQKEITPEQLYAGLNAKDPTVRINTDQVAPARVVQVLGQDGQMHPQTLFNVYNPDAMIALTDSMKEKHPELAHAVGRIPIRVIATAALNDNQEHLATSGLNHQLSDYQSANGQDEKSFDLGAAGEKNPLIKKLYPLINKYRNHPLNVMLDDIEKDPVFKGNQTIQAASAALQTAMGVTPDGLMNQAHKAIEAAKTAAKGAAGEAVDPIVLDTTKTNMATAHPTLTSDQHQRFGSMLYPGISNDNFKKVLDDINKTETANQSAKDKVAHLGVEEQKMLVDYGFSGDQRLTVENSPDPTMIVNTKTGLVVPHKDEKNYAPTMQEKNRADFAHTVLSTMDTLRSMKAAGTLPNGPITGLTADILAKAGMANADAQKAIGTIKLMQTAATGAHVAGRFSLPVLDEMKTLVKLRMNDDQFDGAMAAMEPIMNQYSEHGGAVSVDEYRHMSPKERQEMKDRANDTSPWYHPANTISGPAVNTQANVNTPGD